MKMPRPDKPNWPMMHEIMMFITNAVELVLPTLLFYPYKDKKILFLNEELN